MKLEICICLLLLHLVHGKTTVIDLTEDQNIKKKKYNQSPKKKKSNKNVKKKKSLRLL